MKKNTIFITIFILFVAALWIGYNYYFSNPDSFLSKDNVINQIDEYSQLAVEEIQDITFLDDENVVVFFISTNGSYAQAFWVWENNEWLLMGDNAIGAYTVWKLDEGDLYLIWNVRPDPTLSYVEIIGQRERQYGTTQGNDYYYPELQLTKRIDVTTETYGVEKISSAWKEVIVDFQQTFRQEDDFIPISPSPTELTFGWVPYGPNHKILSVEDYKVSEGSRFGGDIKPIFRLTEDEIQ